MASVVFGHLITYNAVLRSRLSTQEWTAAHILTPEFAIKHAVKSSVDERI